MVGSWSLGHAKDGGLPGITEYRAQIGNWCARRRGRRLDMPGSSAAGITGP